MPFSQFDEQFPPRELKPGAEVISLCLRAQPYLALQDALGALIAHVLARRTEGSFIVHLDDTDPDSLEAKIPYQIFNQLAWMGISPDEFLDLGGYGPYLWRERQHLYQEVAMHLVDQGHAYHCFCPTLGDPDQALPPSQTRQSHHCPTLSSEQMEERLAAGERYLLRFRATSSDLPDHNPHHDAASPDLPEDFVLLTPDNIPLPYFAHVVDNHFMHATTQVRRSSTRPMTLQESLLYRTLGWKMPRQIFIPDVLDLKSRSLFEETRVSQIEALGYRPEALVNLFTDLIWSHPEKKEIYPYSDFLNHFKGDVVLPYEMAVDYELLDRIQTWYAMNEL